MSDTTTTTTTAPKKRTITLTDRPPVTIREDDWPTIASTDYEDYDNQVRSQANRITDCFLKVRQHVDGRVIVYGKHDYDTHWQHEKSQVYRNGTLLDGTPTSDQIVAAIRDVATTLGKRSGAETVWTDLAADCIADLPAEEL